MSLLVLVAVADIGLDWIGSAANAIAKALLKVLFSLFSSQYNWVDG